MTDITALRVASDVAWFRIRGWGLWFKWGHTPDFYETRKHAHYLTSSLRWKVLRP